VQPVTGEKSWGVRYRFNGRPRKLTLGPYPTLGLDDARKAAGVALRSVTAGIDPAAEKIKARKEELVRRNGAETVAVVFEAFLAKSIRVRAKPRNVVMRENLWRRAILPTLGKLRLADVAKIDCKRLCDAINEAGHPAAANKTLNEVRAFFNWCVGESMLMASPCAGLKNPGKAVKRTRFLDSDEIRLFFAACDEEGWPYGPIGKLLALTATRRDEVAGLPWCELNLAKRTWTIPPERAKNGHEHVIALSDAAVAILQDLPSMPNAGGLVFLNSKGEGIVNHSHYKVRLDATMARLGGGPVRPWHLHDLRRTFTTTLAEDFDVAAEITDLCLNHFRGGVSGVYNVSKKLRRQAEAFATWGAHVTALCAPSNVMPMRAVA
jgi:integrase